MQKIFLIFILFLFLSCQKQEKQHYTFYYWKTALSLNSTEKGVLQNTTSPYLYTRFFDVNKIDEKFQPIAIITKDPSFETNKQIVPVVFITNETFLNIKKEEIQSLTKTIHYLIQKKTKEFQLKDSNEIQIDCDWTRGTKNDYFEFLKELKTVSKKKITCTLRLHQVKDKKETGIPPVEKVYLMCYATSSPLENSEKNSILDMAVLKNYLTNLEDYPLKMDVALPIYSWGIVTNHLGKHKLINALTEDDLQHQNFKKIDKYTYEILKDGFYFGMYLNKGFTIKTENIPESDLLEVQKFINQKIKSPHHFIFYHLDSKFTDRYKNLF